MYKEIGKVTSEVSQLTGDALTISSTDVDQIARVEADKGQTNTTLTLELMCIDEPSQCWNPLEEIRVFTAYDVADAQNIFELFIAGANGFNSYSLCSKATINFLAAFALHVRYEPSAGASLATIVKCMGDPGWDNDKQMYAMMMNTAHDPDGVMNWQDVLGKPTKTHPMVANVAMMMLNMGDYHREQILLECHTILAVFLDPIVAKNTNKSTFIMRDRIKAGEIKEIVCVVPYIDRRRLLSFTFFIEKYSFILSNTFAGT